MRLSLLSINQACPNGYSTQEVFKMDSKTSEVKQMASQLLAGMLANPHIYTTISDEGHEGQIEQKLILMAVEMAEDLIDKTQSRHPVD